MKYLNDLRVPWRHKRWEMMAIAEIIPVAKWFAKIKQRSDVSCRLCKRAREQRGASTEKLPEETHGHINSAFCDGMTTTFTAAHHFIWRHLHASMQAARTPASRLRFVTPDKESSITRCGRREILSRYAAENHWRERQQTLKKRLLWKSTKGHTMISTVTWQCYMKIVFVIGGQMA